MMTPGTLGRNRLARIGVRSFLDQTYPCRELLILNHGTEPVGVQDPRVREIMVPVDVLDPDPKDGLARFLHQPSGEIWRVGNLCNVALDRAKGEWLTQWDDDDYPHPNRIMVQMAHRRDGHAVLLASQIRYSFVSRSAFVHHLPRDGLSSTILFPRAAVKHRYTGLPDHFDSVFYLGNFGHKRILVPRSCGPELFCRFHHGTNINGERHIMRKMAGIKAKWKLEPPQRESLARALEHYEEYSLEQYGHSTKTQETP
jgi:hypothetical protein